MLEGQMEPGLQEATAPEQKVLTQDEVNAIIGREKREASERARRQAELEYQQKLEAERQQMQAQMQQAQKAQQAQALDQQAQRVGKPELDPAQITQEVLRKIEQDRLYNEMRQVHQDYLTTMDQTSKKYQDFDQVMNDFAPDEFPDLILELRGNPRAGDILYDLNKDPSKLSEVARNLKERPSLARRMLAQMDASISLNERGKAEHSRYSVPEPLDSLTPSRAQGSNGDMSVEDFKKADWLRG